MRKDLKPDYSSNIAYIMSVCSKEKAIKQILETDALGRKGPLNLIGAHIALKILTKPNIFRNTCTSEPMHEVAVYGAEQPAASF